jgi:hypothetical protein
MRNRFDDAVHISGGACNPVAVAGTIHKHSLEMLRSGSGMDTIRNDPAMRLMVYQLAYLFNVSEFDNSFTSYANVSEFVANEAKALQNGGAA